MTPDSSEDVFGASTFEVTSSPADCSSDSAPAEVSANATVDAQGEMCNAWVAMLRWYELAQPVVIH